MDRYMALLKWTLVNRWKMIGLGVASLGLTVVLFATLPQTFQPTIDVDYSAVKIEMPTGTPLDDTAAVASRAAGLLAEQPEMMTVFQDIGNDGADVRLARSVEHLSKPQSLMPHS